MNKTKIEWTDYSWPIVNGCRRISSGCGDAKGGGCYAERLAATRLAKTEKYKGLAVMTPSGPRWTGETRLWEPALLEPLKIKKPSKIFVADMGDLFYESVSEADILRVFDVMRRCPQHTFQVLTKRAERAYDFCEHLRFNPETGKLKIDREAMRGSFMSVMRHVWFGVSVEDLKTANERITWLSKTPAAVRFLSYEPALESIAESVAFKEWLFLAEPHNSLVIIGGESGPGARPFDIQWARDVIAQCRAANTSVFCKQLGARPIDSSYESGTFAPEDHRSIDAATALGMDSPAFNLVLLKDKKGGSMEEWPSDLRIREFPRGATSNGRR